MKKLLIMLLLTTNVHLIFAQTIEDFNYWDRAYSGSSYMGLGPSLLFLSNNEAPYPERHRVSALSLDVQFKIVNSRFLGSRISIYNKGIGDLVYLFSRMVRGKATIFAKEETVYSNIFGWVDYTVNLNKPNGKFQVSAGLNLGDYVYAGRYRIDSLGIEKNVEPQGYYLAAGPALEMRYLISKSLIVETNLSYAVGLIKFGGLDNAPSSPADLKYPVPDFLHFRTELLSKWGAFMTLDCNWLINKGSNPSSGRRIGLSLGYRIDIRSD